MNFFALGQTNLNFRLEAERPPERLYNSVYLAFISGPQKPDIYHCICSNRGRLCFYAEIEVIFGTVYDLSFLYPGRSELLAHFLFDLQYFAWGVIKIFKI